MRIIRKDIFDQVGGFDLNMTGPEDWDFDKKVRQVGEVGVLDTYDFEKINKKILDIRYRILDEKGFKKLISITQKPIIFHNESYLTNNGTEKEVFLTEGWY